MIQLRFQHIIFLLTISLISQFKIAKAAQELSKLPATIIVIKENPEKFYLLPMHNRTELTSSDKQFFPCSESPNFAAADKKLAPNSPLNERCGALAWFLEKQLGKLNLNQDWSNLVAEFINSSFKLQKNTDANKRIWPPIMPFASSVLRNHNGMILVFVFKGQENAEIIDSIDFITIASQKLTRTYWSRSLNDPTLLETFTGAINKNALSLIKAYKNNNNIKNNSGKTKLEIDKKVQERDLLIIENLIKGLLLDKNYEPILLAYELNKTAIKYTSALPLDEINNFIKKAQETVPNLLIKKADIDAGVLQISAKNTSKNQ